MADSPEREPALATTKRKFNRLLDNLTASASNTSLASTLAESNVSIHSMSNPATPEPPSKRYRLSDASADMERQRNVSGSDRIKALQAQLMTPRKDGDRLVGSGVRVVGQSNNAPTVSTTPRKAPNFQPYSQEQFLERLKTFADVRKWTGKPDIISEVEWAKRGWSCEAWNTVACKGGCEQRVSVKLRPRRKNAEGKEMEMTEDMDSDIDADLVERFRTLIIEGHHEDCLWRKSGCQDDIYHLPIANRAKSQAELLIRYRSLKAMANDLPSQDNIIYPEPKVNDILPRIKPAFWNPANAELREEPPTSPSDITAFTMALFGWAGISESKISLAMCNHCFQRNGLWLYADSRLQEMSKKLEVPIESLRLNLLESHREHCPWKNAQVQGNPSDGPIADMTAWQTLQFMLLGKRREREHRNIESVDLGSEYSMPRGSMDDMDPDHGFEKNEDDSLTEKWKRFKAKLRRTTSRKSLKSVKSVKSVKSTKSSKSVKSVGDKDKENEAA